MPTDLCDQLTIPSPIEEILCASLASLGRPKFDSLSLELTSVGLDSASAARPAMEFLRQTNFSKSCSSLHSRSPMCSEQVLFWFIRSGPKVFTELTSVWLEVT